MSRHAARQQVGVALFPFLAVLICTMGALIVLLVLLVQQARLDATAISAAKQAVAGSDDDEKQRRERLEDAQWRQEMLERSRAEKSQELADSRARLAHLEEHAQRLAARAQELLAQARAIDEGRSLDENELESARAEAARLKVEIERKQREIESKKKLLSDGQQWFALIPYAGASGTRRRPIYVECTEFGVVIQPEGIVLRAEDFTGPLGPGNPLDVALRATREHLENTYGDRAGQPYPLLVVRPGGVAAYGAARAAMKTWDDEFGYELISDEKQLDFGAPDSALSARLSKAVAEARARQSAMIAMMPRRYQADPPSHSSSGMPGTAPRSGGEGGAAIGSGNGAGFGPGASSGMGGIGRGPAGARDRASGSLGWGEGPSAGGAGGAGVGENSLLNAGGRREFGSASGGDSSFAAGSPSASTTPAAYGSNAGINQAVPGGNAAAGGTASATPGLSSGGSSSATGSAAGNGSATTGAPNGTPLPSFTFGEKKNGAPPQNNGGTAGKSGSRSGSAKKGSNWALPNAKPHQIGVTRPIRMTVLPDRLVIVPERGDGRSAQVVQVAPELTQDDVQHFVAAVQKEVDSWGIAVANGYWKPVVQVEVAPGAERHFMNLQTALGGSGIDIMRR